MAKQVISLGTTANDKTGDTLRVAFDKVNDNFTELYDGTGGGSVDLGDFKISGSALGTQAVEGDGWGGYSMYLSPNGEGAAYIGIPNDDSANDGGYLTIANYPNDSGGVRIEANTNYWTFNPNGELTLPTGGTITEGVVTSNPTIQLTPASPDVPSQKLVIKGGGNYNASDNGIGLNWYIIDPLVGNTVDIYVNSPDNADQTLYWWIYPEGAGIATPESGTVSIGSGGAGDSPISFVLDSDDYEFTVRVSTEANNYDSASIGVETQLFNSSAPTFDDVHHLHLTTGDLTETSIFLGTDDHNVRTTVNGGIEITTPNETNNVWKFGSNGDLELPTNGGIVFDRANTTIRVGMGFHIASGEGVSIEAIDETDPEDLVYKSWYFGTDGSLTFPDSTVQETAWSGGRVVAVPTASTGATGDQQGDLAFNGSYIYYCTQNFVQSSYSSTITSTYSGTFPSIVKGSIPQPQAGWELIHDGNTYNLDANATEGNPGEWSLSLTGSISVTIGDSVAIGPASVPNIWKRLAWSGDTW